MKNKLGIAAIYGALLVVASFIPLVRNHIVKSQKYTLQERHSIIQWNGHFDDGKTNTGTIQVKGELSISDRGMVSGGEFKMPFATLSSTNLSESEVKAELIHHFPSTHLDNLSKYSEAVFKIVTLAPDKNTPGAFHATGYLSILGKTNPIDFPVIITFSPNNVEVTSKFTIDRDNWGIGGKSNNCSVTSACANSAIEIQFKLVAVKGKSDYQLM